MATTSTADDLATSSQIAKIIKIMKAKLGLDIQKKITYAKIIGKNFGSYPYRVGLNTLAHNGETFNADPECSSGGLYFCELKNILEWLEHGDQLCIVKPVGQIVAVGNKFKTDRLEIVEMMDLRKLKTWEYLLARRCIRPDSSSEVYKWIVTHGCLDIIKSFVEALHVANDSRIQTMMDTTLILAAGHGQLEIAKYLVDQGADIHVGYGFVLEYAARYGRLDVVKFLVSNGVSVHSRDDIALQVAVLHHHFEVVEFLVDQGVDVRVNDNIAIHAAAGNGHLDIVKFLVEHGADFHSAKALSNAAEYGCLEVVKYLVGLGADVRADNDNALLMAVKFGHREIMEFLSDHGADVAGMLKRVADNKSIPRAEEHLRAVMARQ